MTRPLPFCLLAGAIAFAGCNKKSSDNEKPADNQKPDNQKPVDNQKSVDEQPGAAKPAAPAPAAAGDIAVKLESSPEVGGTYEGSKAIALLSDATGYIMIPRGCGPTFGCGVADDFGHNYVPDKLKAACPSGYVLQVELQDQKAAGDPKAGKHDVGLGVYGVAKDETSGTSGKGSVDISQYTADVVEGMLTYTVDASSASGGFKATVCKEKP